MDNGQQSGAMSKAKGSIAVSIFGILLILFGYLGVNNSPLDKIGDNGVIVYAEVKSFRKTKHNGEIEERNPIIEYRIDGNRYRKELKRKHANPNLEVYDTIRIMVDPDNPEFVVDLETKNKLIPYMSMAVGVLFQVIAIFPSVGRKLIDVAGDYYKESGYLDEEE